MVTIEKSFDKNIETLPIRDLNIASYLLASGEVVLSKSERKDNNLIFFHFAPKNKAELLVNRYYSDTNPLSARNIFNAQRSLKDLIFSGG